MPYLHLPVQSGSDRILARDEPQAYARRLSRARAPKFAPRGPTSRCPPISSSAFPGETEDDFEATLALIEEVGFASAFSFKYSPRPGTPARRPAPIRSSEAVKAARLARLAGSCSKSQRQAFNRAMVGRTLDVLFEKRGRHAGQIAGKTPYLQPVQVDGRRQPHRRSRRGRNRRDRLELAVRATGARLMAALRD